MEELVKLIKDYGHTCRILGINEAVDRAQGTALSAKNVDDAGNAVSLARDRLIAELTKVTI